jgi:hypothetical protein
LPSAPPRPKIIFAFANVSAYYTRRNTFVKAYVNLFWESPAREFARNVGGPKVVLLL